MKASFAVLLAAACSGGGKTPAAHADAWSEFTSEDDNFTLSMPGKPLRAPVPNDPRVKTSAYALLLASEHAELGVAVTKYPESIEGHYMKPLLDGGRDGVLRGFSARVTSEKDITLGAHAGRDFDFETDHFPDIPGHVLGRVRMFIVGDASYEVMLFRAADSGLAKADQERFLDSFRLLHEVVAVDPAVAEVAWHEFRSQAGGFVVLAPVNLVGGEPKQSVNAWSLAGGTIPINVVAFKIPHRASIFAVRWAELTPAAAKLGDRAILDAMVDEIAKRSQITVTAQKPVSLGKHAGREVTGDVVPEMKYDEKNVWRALVRSYVVGRRVYQVVLVAPELEFGLADARRFVDSFRLATP